MKISLSCIKVHPEFGNYADEKRDAEKFINHIKENGNDSFSIGVVTKEVLKKISREAVEKCGVYVVYGGRRRYCSVEAGIETISVKILNNGPISKEKFMELQLSENEFQAAAHILDRAKGIYSYYSTLTKNRIPTVMKKFDLQKYELEALIAIASIDEKWRDVVNLLPNKIGKSFCALVEFAKLEEAQKKGLKKVLDEMHQDSLNQIKSYGSERFRFLINSMKSFIHEGILEMEIIGEGIVKKKCENCRFKIEDSCYNKSCFSIKYVNWNKKEQDKYICSRMVQVGFITEEEAANRLVDELREKWAEYLEKEEAKKQEAKKQESEISKKSKELESEKTTKSLLAILNLEPEEIPFLIPKIEADSDYDFLDVMVKNLYNLSFTSEQQKIAFKAILRGLGEAPRFWNKDLSISNKVALNAVNIFAAALNNDNYYEFLINYSNISKDNMDAYSRIVKKISAPNMEKWYSMPFKTIIESIGVYNLDFEKIHYIINEIESQSPAALTSFANETKTSIKEIVEFVKTGIWLNPYFNLEKNIEFSPLRGLDSLLTDEEFIVDDAIEVFENEFVAKIEKIEYNLQGLSIEEKRSQLIDEISNLEDFVNNGGLNGVTLEDLQEAFFMNKELFFNGHLFFTKSIDYLIQSEISNDFNRNVVIKTMYSCLNTAGHPVRAKLNKNKKAEIAENCEFSLKCIVPSNMNKSNTRCLIKYAEEFKYFWDEDEKVLNFIP